MPETSQIASVVERSRLGDQNATAIIACTRERAEAGNPLAKKSLEMIVSYAKSNPPGSRGAQIGGVLPRGRSSLANLRDGAKRCASQTDYVRVVVDLVPKVGLTVSDADTAGAALSVGPPVSGDVLSEVQSTFASPVAQQAFQFAVKNCASPAKVMGATKKCSDPNAKRALHLGYVMGCARRVQLVRQPDSSLAQFNPVVGYELGEDTQ